jgi:hypothetical protein
MKRLTELFVMGIQVIPVPVMSTAEGRGKKGSESEKK